jgi:hypothetical protein
MHIDGISAAVLLKTLKQFDFDIDILQRVDRCLRTNSNSYGYCISMPESATVIPNKPDFIRSVPLPGL